MRLPTVDHGLWTAVLVSAIVVLPRSYLVSRAHNENIDADYHLRRGALFLKRSLGATTLNDPPTGEAIGALPLAFSRSLDGRWERSAIYGKRLPPETIVTLVALWKSILFLPMVGVMFVWCRRLYGAAAAWLAVGLLLVEPTFAAHIPSGALDVLGTEGIVVACFLAWRFFETPSYPRLLGAAAALTLALTLKHTSVILPAVVALMGLVWRWRRPATRRLPFSLPIGVGTTLLALWTFTLFDVSTVEVPKEGADSRSVMARLLDRPWPAGIYARSFLTGLQHDREGHEALLLGERRRTGWWFYFPVVATYKVPLGIGLVLLLGGLSLLVRRPRFEEWGLAVPLMSWLVLLTVSRIDIGFRHFLPPYAFLLMLATRCVAIPARVWTTVAGGGLLAAAAHVASFHPDYLSYLNFPRRHAYLDISDSNLDWGESLKQVRAWIDARPQSGRPIHLRYFWRNPHGVAHYLEGRVVNLSDDDPPPSGGLLIISPVWVAGVYDPQDRYARLRAAEPIDVIGHCMLVYDLDRR